MANNRVHTNRPKLRRFALHFWTPGFAKCSVFSVRAAGCVDCPASVAKSSCFASLGVHDCVNLGSLREATEVDFTDAGNGISLSAAAGATDASCRP